MNSDWLPHQCGALAGADASGSICPPFASVSTHVFSYPVPSNPSSRIVRSWHSWELCDDDDNEDDDDRLDSELLELYEDSDEEEILLVLDSEPAAAAISSISQNSAELLDCDDSELDEEEDDCAPSSVTENVKPLASLVAKVNVFAPVVVGESYVSSTIARAKYASLVPPVVKSALVASPDGIPLN